VRVIAEVEAHVTEHGRSFSRLLPALTPGDTGVLLDGTYTGGTTISLVLTFQNAGTVHMRVPVLGQVQEYGTFSPAPPPSPTPTPGAHRHRRLTPSPSVSGTTTSPTPTPTPTA